MGLSSSTGQSLEGIGERGEGSSQQNDMQEVTSENWVFAMDPIGYLCVAGSLFESRTQNRWVEQKARTVDSRGYLLGKAEEGRKDDGIPIRLLNKWDGRKSVGRGLPGPTRGIDF
jgi:hypothetical protein